MREHDNDLLGPLGDALRGSAERGLDPAAQSRIEDALQRRLSAPPTRRLRLRAWVASHVVIAAAAGVVSVAGAGATAAVVIQQVQGTPSPPTQGEVPRVAGEHRQRDLRYAVTMAPQADVGSVGWCSSMQLRYERTTRPFGGTGCGPAPLEGRQVFGGGTTYMGRRRGLIAYSVVDAAVAYALTDDEPPRRLIPASDPGLPNGWRVIVQLPGESHTGNLRYRDAAGRPVRSGSRGGGYADRRLPSDWSRTTVDAHAPCAITPPAGTIPRGSRWLTALTPTSGLAGRALLPCAQTRFKLGDRWAEATVFLDAAQPATATPMPMPGSAGRGGLVDVELAASHYTFEPAGRERLPNGDLGWGGQATARRVGAAWLVVRSRLRADRERHLREVGVSVRRP